MPPIRTRHCNVSDSEGESLQHAQLIFSIPCLCSASQCRDEWLVEASALPWHRRHERRRWHGRRGGHAAEGAYTTASSFGKLASPCGTIRVPPHSTQLLEDGHQSPSHLVLGKFRQLGQDLSQNSAGLSQTNIAVAAGNHSNANAGAAVGAAQKDEWFV